MRLIDSMCIAFSTYSRIPMPHVEWSDENRRYSMCFFPLIGAVIGAALVLWMWLCDRLGLGAFLRGAVGAMIPLLVTGGIHMDGFMDTADAMASWQPREKRLEILKDTHTGAFAVIHCAAYLLTQAAVLGELCVQQALALTGVFILSRAMSAAAMVLWPKARKDGMLAGFSRTAQEKTVLVACGAYVLVSTAVLVIFGGWLVALVTLAMAGLSLLWYWQRSRKYFGGVTGDLAGWFVQVTELGCMLAMMLGGMGR